ncbi:MAG: hypothetical protein IPK19_04120 [Chloroflexi bacterium]|nr:hypothetical protein [Chloroflexota bacterium]
MNTSRRLIWLASSVGGAAVAVVLARRLVFNRQRARREALASAQLLADASLGIKSGVWGLRLRHDPNAPLLSQAHGSQGETPIDPTVFQQVADGHGAFGHWIVDANGLPAYVYELDNRRNRLAYYVNSQGLDRRDHWHQIGNDRVTGLACNDGVVQLFLADRGGILLNRYAPEADAPHTLAGYLGAVLTTLVRIYHQARAQYFRWRTRDKIVPRGVNPLAPAAQEHLDAETEYAYAGGYSYLSDGVETWATAHRFAPRVAKTHRVFGAGYFESETIHRDIHYSRRVYAPYGDQPALLSDVTIANVGQAPVSLRCYEYWDVNIHQLRVQWVRSGAFAADGDARRALINSRYKPVIAPDLDGQALRFRQQRYAEPPLTDEELRGFVDPNPPDVFLANLSGPALPPADAYFDKRAFFGNGGPLEPEAVRHNLPGGTDDPEPGDSMPYCLVLRHDLHLEPGETVRLRFACGALPQPEQSLAFLDQFRHDQEPLAQTLAAWKKQIAYFSTGISQALQRETSWHAYNLLAATLYSEFYRTHYTPQGAAYLYLHGADGAPRDQALFVLPLVYVRPALAREMLILLMRMRSAATGALPYSFVGHGAHDNALGLHAGPSDLDLFFLLAIGEYLAATGDRAFLREEYELNQPGRPPAPGPKLTVLQHIQAAFDHLEGRGLGPHDLLVMGTGDWDDAIVATRTIRPDFDRERTIRQGESIPNSQMALYILPLVANLIAAHDPDLARRMRGMAGTLRGALLHQWDDRNGWFYRAWVWYRLGGNDLVGDSTLSLQAQVWPLISGLAAEMGIEDQLIATLCGQLDDDSPTGPMLEPKGQIWPAVSQLLTWGYRRSRPDLAWRSLNRHSFGVHASAFPSVWFNIWTGPDGTNSDRMANPGGTWASPVTPMTDFPGMNANQDAMALLGLLRVCGVEPPPGGDGLLIAPKGPPDRFVLRTELLNLDVAPGRISGEYRAANDGAITLHVVVPADAVEVTATVNGALVTGVGSRQIDLPLQFVKGQGSRST